MTSIIKLHAISGAMGESPPCYILQIDDFRFLLDCGWDEKFDMEYIDELKQYKYQIDAILLSHSDTYHLGALPYLVGKCGFVCPVYATIPVFKMGQMSMYDLHTSRNNSEQFDIFNLDDIDLAFEKILQLEYNHPFNFEGRGKGITITALPAGHSLGGTIWKISKTGNEDIYYAIDHNNKKERHLNGCEMETVQKPGIFITNAFNALYDQEKRRQRDEKLMGVMKRTLLSGGNVLIATDTASRSLELILMLDQMWKMKSSGLAPYSLVFLNNLAFNITGFAKSQIEWMGDKLRKSFETNNINPFNLPNVQVCHDLTKLSQIAAPKVVVTSSADLECGFARDLFLQWCQDPRSSVILTNRTSPGTLARNLIDKVIWRGQKVDLEVRQKVKLEGKELEEYLQERRNEKKRKLCMIEYEDSSDEEESAEVNISVVTKKNGTIQHDLSIRPSDGLVTVNDSSFFRLNNNNHPTFPSDSPQKKRRFDDYGEVISHEDFKENQKRRNEVPPRNRRNTLSSSSDKVDPEAPPTKFIASTQTFSIKCEVMFIDFEGRSDIEALAKMITEMQPKKLVIVRGPAASINALETLAQTLLPNVNIYKPSQGQVIDLSDSNKIFQVRLKDDSSLKFQNVKDLQVSWVHGNVVEEDSSEVNPLRVEPVFESLPPTEVPANRPVVIHRLRLNDFRKILVKEGFQSEVKDGVIHCVCPNGVVYIQKDPKTKSLHIECDGLPEEYYKIRSLLYSQIAFL